MDTLQATVFSISFYAYTVHLYIQFDKCKHLCVDLPKTGIHANLTESNNPGMYL